MDLARRTAPGAVVLALALSACTGGGSSGVGTGADPAGGTSSTAAPATTADPRAEVDEANRVAADFFENVYASNYAGALPFATGPAERLTQHSLTVSEIAALGSEREPAATVTADLTGVRPGDDGRLVAEGEIELRFPDGESTSLKDVELQRVGDRLKIYDYALPSGRKISLDIAPGGGQPVTTGDLTVELVSVRRLSRSIEYLVSYTNRGNEAVRPGSRRASGRSDTGGDANWNPGEEPSTGLNANVALLWKGDPSSNGETAHGLVAFELDDQRDQQRFTEAGQLTLEFENARPVSLRTPALPPPRPTTGTTR